MRMDEIQELKFHVSEKAGDVSAILRRPENARCLLAFAHGAGAGMRHRFMDDAARVLGARGIATLRYQFPYTEAGRKRPDHASKLLATVRAAVGVAREHAGDLPLLAGGKSMGGRMTSTAASEEPLPDVRGIVFFGFPLHAPGRPGAARGEHLRAVGIPMLFLQGTRDNLADLTLLTPLLEEIDHTKLHIVEGSNHSFHVPKRSGRTDAEVLEELGDAVAAFAKSL